MKDENTLYPQYRQKTMDGITLDLEIHSRRPQPLIVLISARPERGELLASCRRQGCKAFSLLTITGFGWDECLSPWPHTPCIIDSDHFAGQAGAFLSWIEKRALPWAKSELEEAPLWTGLAGYSMGGLFAIYASLKSSVFSRFASVSGSLWYPDFASWVLSQHPAFQHEAVYFSLGTTETKTANVWLQTTAQKTEQIAQYFADQGVATVFEWNPGNHFQNPDARIARALAWLLASPAQEDENPS